MTKKMQKQKMQIIVSAGTLTFVSLCILFWIHDLAPFGNKSLAVSDANVQYLDFFSYFKDVLSGENSIFYTFGKVLGGSNVAVFSYYLSSPFNFLLIFFDDLQFHTFFDLVVALKIALASSTFAYFLVHRFENLEENHSQIYIVIAIGYGLCQYSFSQNSNIMWLDGVYMLPLILLQIYYLVQGRKHGYYLAILVGIAIIFNWYSAGINCVFSVFWFIFEICLNIIETKPKKIKLLQVFCKYIILMALGVMLSAALFFPTIGALRKSTRGSLQFSGLMDFSMLGDIPSAIQKYTYGSNNTLGGVALFCGSLAIVLALSSLFNKKIDFRKRVVISGLLLCSILFFYWKPLHTMFSLFQLVYSFHYRYSYVTIFVILFLAMYGSSNISDQSQSLLILKISVIFSTGLIILFYIKPVNERAYVYATALFMVFETSFYLYVKFAKYTSNMLKRLCSVGFIVVGILDLMFNANFLIEKYSKDGVSQYQTYRINQESLISSIKKDQTYYRISQTTNRGTNKDQLTANYNESLSYNYASISGYTSSPDDNQREFLNNLGYPINGENMCITNTSILGADSLLGVKYILSPFGIKGLEKVNAGNGKEKLIYRNPYAFPLAFVYENDMPGVILEEVANPFEYQNALYKKIFGLSENLYVPVEFTVSQEENNTLKIYLKIPTEENVAVYGSIPWNSQMDSSIFVNGQFLTKYACWLSPTVFYIPYHEGVDCELEVRFDSMQYKLDSLQFYAIDLEVLQICYELAKKNEIKDLFIKNGFVEATVENGQKGEHLFLSIPADSGWDITLNGQPANFELIGNCLYSIELINGVNKLEMVYHVQYIRLGTLITLLAAAVLCAWKYYERNVCKKGKMIR